MDFKILGRISNIEIIAIGSSIRILPFLQQKFGRGRWRKLKGMAEVRLVNGDVRMAEVHWFEAHGIGKKLLRIKRYLD
ncbi:MAG: hypothetical protein IT174_09025 [Acidobacteria bacterium]|nr:hypothetical protein [Acidobacteriota bacterium]